MTTEHALSNFYNRNGYGFDGGASKKWVSIKFGPLTLPIPNFESRSQNVYLHDINHVVTGYDTTWKGESSVSGWEVASGGWGNLYYPWLLTLWALGVGVIFFPKATYQAFQAGLRMKNGLTGGLSKQEMYSLSLDELRVKLQRPAGDVPPQNFIIWAVAGVIVWASPLLGGLLIYYLL